MRRIVKTAAAVAALAMLSGCASKPAETTAVQETEAPEAEETEITVAAAASLKTCMDTELIPLFQEENPEITVLGTYDSSGKLQTQIEEGADVDVFFSAAVKQMTALDEKDMIEDGSIVNLLENKIVLIVPSGEEGITSFEDLAGMDGVALGDPESVPVGQYAKEALTNLGIWDEVSEKASFGTNVTEVLNWVAAGSSKAGIVYSTDAAQKPDEVVVVAEAPEGSVKKVVYPVGMIKESSKKDAAKKFIEFLQSDEAIKIFEANGFAAAE